MRIKVEARTCGTRKRLTRLRYLEGIVPLCFQSEALPPTGVYGFSPSRCLAMTCNLSRCNEWAPVLLGWAGEELSAVQACRLLLCKAVMNDHSFSASYGSPFA